MLKVYVQENGLKMVGKAKDIIAKLREYNNQHETVHEFLSYNNQKTTKKSPCALTHDMNSFTIIMSKQKVPKLTNYYLLFPSNNKRM
ncbi:Z-ring formation inhibitor MciZ [Bacillus sp. Marseille-P3661]|uniref:Z-ring formation inhibitor MciZ n=1 Tax=Bacillus sp. Marseille-P3661 TaxID=1936234 RepID=UPI000C849C00|nr:Z-ring formation inhibitor MciZ [Bacillus sp. Marseille-P3661]